MNPEFRRHLWLQLSWPRLVLTPLVLGALFVVLHSTFGPVTVAKIGFWSFWLAAGVWGTRRAAESVNEEVAGGTWHSQRMSSLGAWAMTWGKLLGATAFPWYVALMCLIAQQVSWTMEVASHCATPAACLAVYERFWPAPAWMILIVLSAHAAAMAVTLAALRRRPLSPRLPVIMAQGLSGLFIAIFLIGLEGTLAQHDGSSGISRLAQALQNFQALDQRPVRWFGLAMDGLAVRQIGLVVLLGLCLLCAYRLMRVALQYRAWPWGLVVGTAVTWLLVIGLLGAPFHLDLETAAGICLVGFWLTVVAFYGGLFSDRIDFPRLLRLSSAVRRLDPSAVLRLSPSWLPVFLLALLLGIVPVLHAVSTPVILPLLRGAAPVDMAPAIAAQMLNLFRDLAVVHWFHMGASSRRADLAALVTLAVLYLLVPFAISAAGAVVPMIGLAWASGGVRVGLAAIEAVVACLLLAARWRTRARALPAPAPSRM